MTAASGVHHVARTCRSLWPPEDTDRSERDKRPYVLAVDELDTGRAETVEVVAPCGLSCVGGVDAAFAAAALALTCSGRDLQ